jgi:hypothetical protein
VVFAFVAVALVLELAEDPFAELVDPAGAAGGVSVGGGVLAVTVSAKLQTPLSPEPSESVPVTVCVATVRMPLVDTAPVDETMTWVESVEGVSTNVTGPTFPVVRSWLVKPPDAAASEVPVVGADWVMVTVSAKVQAPVSPEESDVAPETV